MANRRIEAVSRASQTVPSRPVKTCQTNSILTDPNASWVADRQSEITAGLERQWRMKTPEPQTCAMRLSGESQRIGTWEGADGTEFGRRFGYV